MKPRTEITLRVRAMRYLARREYGRQELRSKLLAFVQEGDDVDALLDDLERRNWLSDTRAAAQLINQRQQRFGAQRIVHELQQKGIAQDLIDAALLELKENELAAAREVWQKKFGQPPQDAKEKARQVRFLQSRGFPMAVVFKLLRMDDFITLDCHPTMSLAHGTTVETYLSLATPSSDTHN